MNAILDAAEQLLATGDPHQLQMTTLARRAGVSNGTLYQYFPGWASVLGALSERAWASAEKEFRTRLQALDRSALPNVLVALSQLVAEITHRDQALRRAVREEHQKQHAGNRSIDESEQWAEDFVNILRPFFSGDEARLRSIARAMVWAADGIVEGSMGHPDTTLADLRETLLALWRGVVAPTDPAP